MTWNVYRHNITTKKIVQFNIFSHSRFERNVLQLLKDFDDKEEFAKELRNELLYTYWCKSEYEVIISPWSIHQNECDIKVDIYSQVMLNWEIFVNYVWGFKK